jgi:hypothetical protein
MLEKLPIDILLKFNQFFTNSDSCIFINICKHIYIESKKNGYIKRLDINQNTDMKLFFNRFCDHFRTITTITATNFIDTHIWIPYYPENVKISGYKITPDYFTTNNSFNNIKIFEFNDQSYSKDFKTDWSKFKNLEFLTMCVKTVDILSIEKYCKKLKYKNIKIRPNNIIISCKYLYIK